MDRRLIIKNLTIQTASLLAFPQVLSSSDHTDQSRSREESDLERMTRMFKEKNPLTWLFTGDSITQGAKHTMGMRSFPEIFGERVRWEMGRFNDTVINTGISGNTSQDILNGFENRVAKYNPDVVFLMIGTNDATTGKNISPDQFSNNLILLTDRIRAIGSIPVLISPNRIILNQAPQRSRLEEFVNQMRRVVDTKNLVFVDIWNVWDGELQVKFKGKVNDKLLNDALHPNGNGHKEIAIAIFKALSIFDPLSPTCISAPVD